MHESSTVQPVLSLVVLRRLRMGFAMAAAGVALLSLVGTVLDKALLAAMGQDLVPMSPLGAGLVVLLSLALLAVDRWPGADGARTLACVLAGSAGLLSLGFVLGHEQGDAMAFERWLVQAWPRFQLTSLLTDLALLGAALSFLLRWVPASASWRLRQGAALVSLVPVFLGGVVLISYAAGAPLLYGTGRIPMALPTALSVLLLGLALHLSAGCDTWPLAAFRTGPGLVRRWSVFGLTVRTLTLFFLLASLVLVSGSFYLRKQLQAARGQVRAELTTIADAKVRQIGDWYGERRNIAERIHHPGMLQTQLASYLAGTLPPSTAADVRAWMATLQKDAYRHVVLFDGQGRVRAAAPSQEGPGALDLDADELQAALQATEVLVRDLHQHPGQTDIQLGFWIPVGTTGPTTKARGVLLLQVDPRQYLFPLIQTWPTASPSAETLLVRREGDDILYLNDLRHRAGTSMRLRLPVASDPDAPAIRSLVGNGLLAEGRDYRGVQVLAVMRRVPGTRWAMVAKVDAAEVYAPLRLRVWTGVLGLLAALLLVSAVLGLLLKHHDAEMVRTQLHLAQRFEWLMREANDIILILDGDGRIVEANTRAVERYGYSLPELQGLSVLDLRPPATRAEARGTFQQAKAEGAIRFEAIHLRRDGSTFPVEVSTRSLRLDGELRVISFIRDISERRAQEQELQRMTQLYSALSQVNQSIVWSPNREALFDRICEVMIEFGRFEMAWIGLDDPRTHQVTVVASNGDAGGYLSRVRIESGDSPLGMGPVGTAIREARAVVENDFLLAGRTAPWHEAAAECGYRSVAAFPIRQAGEVIGALTVYATEQGFFGAPEEALLVEAAMDISFALDHLAGEEQRQRTEVALLESERLLLQAQEAGGIGTYTWYIREDRWISSPYLDQIFGIGPDYPRNLEGWMGLVAPEFREELSAYVARIIERHERFDLDYPTVRPTDGARRWVHGSGDIQWDDEGQPVALVGVIQDITERKVSERSLRKISVAVEQSPLSIVITDPQGVIEYVNPMFTQVTGYTAGEALGQNPRILKSPTTPADFYRTMWDTLARGEVWMGEFENLKKNGEAFFERATIAPVRDETGHLVGYIAIKDDITQLKQDELERRSLESQLQQSQRLESLGSLAGGVAHDMNNVLGAILGLASSLREKADPFTASAKSLDTIVNACMRGRGVVKSLLYFAKKDLQEERTLDLNDLVREMSQLLSHTMLQRIQLKLDLDDGLSLLRGDPGALSHALMNLCVNAVDAMPGGGTLLIRTGSDSDGGLVLSVRDSGEGMPAEVLAKAMEPFFTTKAQGKGTGLGLPMVYGTMLAHEGTFRLSSQPGQGTEAILRFPASRVAAGTPDLATAPAVGTTSHETLRILLVDDDDLIREAVAPLLEMLGHTVATASGGAQALSLLQCGLKVDLVILDMNMPAMSGAEALPRILNLRPGLPVIMATGYSDREIAPLLVGQPTVSSIRKPFSLSEMQLKIAELHIQRAGDRQA